MAIRQRRPCLTAILFYPNRTHHAFEHIGSELEIPIATIRLSGKSIKTKCAGRFGDPKMTKTGMAGRPTTAPRPNLQLVGRPRDLLDGLPSESRPYSPAGARYRRRLRKSAHPARKTGCYRPGRRRG